MANYLGSRLASSTVYVYFDTFAGSTGAPITLTGLAVTDIEIYKNDSMTQRSSDNGYTLIDTDGIDVDSRTGIHGFKIDLSDNSDSGFYAAGNFYTVVVDAVTIDSQTVRFIAAQFDIVAAPASVQDVVDALLNEAVASHVSAGSVGERIERLDILQSGGSSELTTARAALLSNLDAAVTTRSSPADVNAQVLDVLNTDTFAEPGQGTPAATTTLAVKIGYLYKFLRNKVTKGANSVYVYNDDGVTIGQQATTSDDGTTYVRNEFVSG